MKRKKWLIVSVLLLAVITGLRCIRYSEPWLQWRKENLRTKIAESFEEDGADYAAFAQLMREYSASGEDFSYYDSAYLKLPEDLIRQAEDFIDARGIPFTDLYMGGMTSLVYPDDACVFRSTLWIGDQVYCWVDLVHSEKWDPQELHTRETVLTPQWRIVILWGF